MKMKKWVLFGFLASLGWTSCDSPNDETDNSRGGKMFEEAVSKDSLNAETTVDGEEQRTDTVSRRTKRDEREYEREAKTGKPSGSGD